MVDLLITLPHLMRQYRTKHRGSQAYNSLWDRGHPDGTKVYVVNSGSNNVSVIHRPGNTVVATIWVGKVPRGVAITPNGTQAYVVNESDNTVSVIDTVTNTVAGLPIPVGSSPDWVAITPDGTQAYVTNGGGNVSVIKTANRAVVATIPVGIFPTGVAFTPDTPTSRIMAPTPSR
jgi:YVTN family beta-propeller protein